MIPPPTTGREKRKQKPRFQLRISRVVEHHDRRRLAGKAAGQPEASQCASGSGRRPKKDLFLNAPNFPQGAAGTRWTPMRRQRQTAATTRPPRTRRATMAASPALPPAGPLPTPLRPAWERRGGGNRFTGFRNLGTDFYSAHAVSIKKGVKKKDT